MICYYNRELESVEIEREFKKDKLEFLYNTVPGRIMLKSFIARPIYSKINGLYEKSFLSQKDIREFAKRNNISISENEIKEYQSFNDFFTREHDTLPKSNKYDLIAPADSRMMYYPINQDLHIKVKRSVYKISDLLKDDSLAKEYAGGTCLVFRLAVDDNHHYFYMDGGSVKNTKKIKGELHTVRPISEEYNVYTRNAREVSVLQMDQLGQVVQVEVGALLVGKIKNEKKTYFNKCEEKGHFEFGGSTIIVLLKKNIGFDQDIKNAVSQGIEVKVTAGERIGKIC